MSIEAIIIGCFTGFISAFFGIGGSSIDTPLLRELLGFPPYLALGTPLPTAFVTIVVALLTYWKSHLVNYRIFFYSIIGGLPGIILGSYLSHLFPGTLLMMLTAIVLFLIGGNFIVRSLHDNDSTSSPGKSRKRSSLAGASIAAVTGAVGVVSGILANGGGLLLIPAYILLFKLKMKEAIATSLLTVAVISVPASIIHFSLGHIDLATSAAMALGAMPMAYLGAKMDLKTKPGVVQMLFGILLVMFSIYFFMNQTDIL